MSLLQKFCYILKALNKQNSLPKKWYASSHSVNNYFLSSNIMIGVSEL